MVGGWVGGTLIGRPLLSETAPEAGPQVTSPKRKRWVGPDASRGEMAACAKVVHRDAAAERHQRDHLRDMSRTCHGRVLAVVQPTGISATTRPGASG